MIIYFADRQLNIIGQASTELPEGLIIEADKKTGDVETGVSVFECKIPFDEKTRAQVEDCTEVGNYILRFNDGENELYTIIDAEIDTKRQEIYIYAEDDGMDLLNEIVGSYAADQAYPISHYINKYAAGAGFEIGINEAKNLARKLSWDGEATAAERIASVATQFDGCEVSYSFEVDGLYVAKKYINIYKKRGKDVGVTLRLNQDIDSIITTKSIANLATALKCTGGTPEDKNLDDDVEPEAITLDGYKYDDGDFYVDGGIVKSREALKRWSRFLWKTAEAQKSGGHIVRPYSYDTLSQKTLCSRAISELKKIRDMEVNYEVDIKKLPDNVEIGDRINIVDDAGELYVSARVLKLETSVADQEYKATLGEYLIKSSGIHQKVAELAAQFAKTSQSAARALQIANNAKSAAASAQIQADTAAADAENAQKAADEATAAANTAAGSAAEAKAAADNAQAAVETVEKSVASLETTVSDAQKAAEQAQQAAETADAKAVEAQQAAVNAQAKANEAATAAGTAQNAAESAAAKADNAQSAAAQAKTNAEAAATTAAAAKLDAENAQKDIDAFGENLTTLENTMTADFARKTDLTEATASLQTQISQNADEISSTATQVQKIDETANSAAEQAQAAQTAAGAAQAKADQATADAQAAQTAADNAAAAATAAQSEADTAKAAAATAQSVADKAEADLEAAKADLATVSSRVDATEEEITAAQKAVETAQAAADKADEDAQEAAKKAAAAQSTADTAVTNASTAQAAANDAASKANLAQQTADAAKGDAAAAQTAADEAAAAAAEAQRTANAATSNAANAQAKADAAATAAANAQKAADDADAKAAQAATDLATAQENLAAVTSRVDATAEEVAAAQAAVATAQQAADKAKEEAETAQATADTAKANAATAQQAANNAKAAADEAQAAADEAQAAADAAQKDVDALAVRVTTAETKITQNSEQIALMATKKEVTQTLGGYSTTEEMQAAIDLKANAITSSVSNTYATKQAVSNIKIGGRNLVPVSSVQSGRNVTTTEEFELRNVWATPFVANENLIKILEPNTQYTARYNLELIERTSIPTKFDMLVGFLIYSAAYSTWISLATQMPEDAEIGTTKTVEVTFTTPEVWHDEAIICYSRRWTTEGANPVGFDAFTVTDFKIEKGNKATDWTPAPEDVDRGIAAAQNAADNAAASIQTAETIIQQLADSIAQLVRDGNGGSLIKQDANGLWYFNIGEIEENISDTANAVDELNGVVLDANGEIDVLKSTAEALKNRTEYVRSYTDENGQPCLELGEGDSVFKVRITNTEIQFAEGTAIPTRINRQMLIIEKAMVRNELQFGDEQEVDGVWIWKRRANGNLGLMWRRGAS